MSALMFKHNLAAKPMERKSKQRALSNSKLTGLTGYKGDRLKASNKPHFPKMIPCCITALHVLTDVPRLVPTMTTTATVILMITIS